MINYLYHWVPKDMQGDILYPLNVLKEKYPNLYADYVRKYEGREWVMDGVIPTLNCLWNDVLHLSPIHPSVVKEALTEAGRDANLEMTCYEIDPNILDPEKTTVYLYNGSDLGKVKEDEFIPFNLNDIKKYSFLPQETKDYYKEEYDQGRKPLVFHRVVHILYKGEINIKDLPIIRV